MLLENQVIPVYKPRYYSSFDIIRYLRREYGLKKIGHAGTLDPLAEGLLLLCTGRATKQIATIIGQDKEYVMELSLGAETASCDCETEPENLRSFAHVSEDLLAQTFQNFVGEIEQYPPIYSAIKKQGRRLYQYARAGEQVQISPRQVQIYALELLRVDLPRVVARVSCSKGTYIRSLARDIGKALNCGAFLSRLERSRIGEFHVKDALKIIPEKPEWRSRYLANYWLAQATQEL